MIETFRTSMQLDWHELASGLSPEEKAGIREHVEACAVDLKEFLRRLWALDEGEISK